MLNPSIDIIIDNITNSYIMYIYIYILKNSMNRRLHNKYPHTKGLKGVETSACGEVCYCSVKYSH